MPQREVDGVVPAEAAARGAHAVQVVRLRMNGATSRAR